MSAGSKIEWTDHTFNPWWGCEKVSPACKHCYAELFAKRVGQKVWGAGVERRLFGDKHWAEPIAWNVAAAKAPQRARVFCASMADVFEGLPSLNAQRARLWKLIESTASLDWLLLTKRPENIASMAPWRDGWPANVWLGATVENQQYADQRIPALLENAAKVRFLSIEPLLGPIDLRRYLADLDWVIVGGESGGSARPSNIAWVRDLRDQCVDAGVAFFFKQWGNHAPDAAGNLVRHRRKDHRLLDGRTWDEFPTPRAGAAR